MKCALCGRQTMPAVYIGSEAVGPKCAKRAGLLALVGRRGSRVAGAIKAQSRKRGADNLELFPDEVAA
jgi:hypothetical protein